MYAVKRTQWETAWERGYVASGMQDIVGKPECDTAVNTTSLYM